MTEDARSLRERVFIKLRNDILKGNYKQGEELVESTIGKEMGVSRTPVREAIRQLELEGLVKLVPNKGAFVTGITAQDVNDIYNIRARLEGLCAGMAADNATKEQLDAMEEVIFLSGFHARKENYEQVNELDGKFHELLYEASGSRILSNTLSDFHQYVQRARAASIRSAKRLSSSNKEHQEILEAIRKRDKEKAEKAATGHIFNTIENLKKYDMEHLLKTEK